MKIFLASKNAKKMSEMQRLLEPMGITVLSESNSEYRIDDVEETGSTFEENARLKAESACRCTGLPSVADDSGLCVDALDGAPGIYSARFSGEGHNDKENNEKLLLLLQDVPSEQRTARFVCAVCCVFPDGRCIQVRGECEGMIDTSLHGEGGFGYDPLFLYGDRSFGQLSEKEKDQVSHRGKAMRAFVQQLRNEIKENTSHVE